MLGVGDSLNVGGNTASLSTLVCGPIQHGSSPLYIAAQEGYLEVVRALLEGGADVNQSRQVCAYLYIYLKLMACTQVFQLCHELHKMHKVHELNEVHELPQCSVQVLHCVRVGGITNLTSILVYEHFQDGVSSLHVAASTGHLDIVRVLLENGADVNPVEQVCVVVL